MELTEQKITNLKKAFTISATALAIVSVFGAENEALKGYTHAILTELNKEKVDGEYLELILAEYKSYMEKNIAELIDNQNGQE